MDLDMLMAIRVMVFFTRNDGSHFYLMLTDQGNPLDNWNSLRPFMMTLSSGDINFGTNCTFNNSIKTAGVKVYSNDYPGFTINNTSGQRLATLFQTSNTGGFGSFTVRVYSAANTYTDASFGSNGYLYTKGLTLSDTNHGPLTIERSGTTYYASIRFKNSLGTLGYLGMTSVDGALCKGNSTASDFYALLDASNWSNYCMSKSPAYIEFSPSSTGNYGGYLDFHYNNSSANYTSRIIEDASGQLTINGVHFKSSQIIAGSYAVPRVKSWDGSTLTLVP